MSKVTISRKGITNASKTALNEAGGGGGRRFWVLGDESATQLS